MNTPRMIGFSAFSGTGKTTLIEQLVLRFKASGLRVAVIKHDAHDFDIDHEGKDSWRFSHAGADMMILSSPTKTAVVEQRPHTLSENLALVHDVDLILVEGYKNEPIPQIGISRMATGKGLPYPAEHYLAVVTDGPAPAGIPCFGLDEVDAIAAFVLSHAQPWPLLTSREQP